jgi:hypothetical protein
MYFTNVKFKTVIHKRLNIFVEFNFLFKLFINKKKKFRKNTIIMKIYLDVLEFVTLMTPSHNSEERTTTLVVEF